MQLAAKLRHRGIEIKGVRIDSGDLIAHARRVRDILNRGGLSGATIFASGNLDEHKIQDLLRSGAPIDGFGIGTRMNTSADAPYLDCAYKLAEYAGAERRKGSEGKSTWPGRKQVYRGLDVHDRMTGDLLTLEDDRCSGLPLLRQEMRNGQRVASSIDLRTMREYCATQVAMLPPELTGLETMERYPVVVSNSVKELAVCVDAMKN